MHLSLSLHGPEEVNDEFETFRVAFDTVWRQVGRPSFGETMDAFVEALGENGRPEREALRPLFDFMRTAANNGAALNWFAKVAEDIAYDEAVRRGLVARKALLQLLKEGDDEEGNSAEPEAAVS